MCLIGSIRTMGPSCRNPSHPVNGISGGAPGQARAPAASGSMGQAEGIFGARGIGGLATITNTSAIDFPPVADGEDHNYLLSIVDGI